MAIENTQIFAAGGP